MSVVEHLARSVVAWAGLASLLLMLPFSARADAVSQLRSFLSQTQSARGEFTQRVSGKSSTAQNSSGQFAFQRPGKFRWVYQKPYQQTLVADGTKLFIHDADLNQVTVKKLQAALPASPASILFGGGDFEREFNVSEDGERDGLAWIKALPKTKDSPYERIDIGFKDGLPAAMRILDSFGQTSTLAFRGVERNPKLDPAGFAFTPPAGADVLVEP